ncbi:OmpA family protein [Halomonas sp. ML-15]|uniref:OmpA family protein n=1 Tax=Halomonas sp. ML-15 TaxID=2773305 RepID=UPI0017462264|nr:OmpA family protein [Halomonas sp. ML-15]MBD3898070.1 OmpA family protein [Halomonas sp. ML-15]
MDEESEVHFPDLDSSYLDTGDFINPEAIHRISEGQSKDQVRLLLGDPHFSEGFFAVREWDYAFNFYTGEGTDYITCQYKLFFDQSMRVKETHWQRPECASLIFPVEVDAPDVGERVHDVTLSSDILFAFDSSDLSLEGRRGLDELANTLAHDFSNPGIVIEGHTDRLGEVAYNQALSERRAAAVKAYLIAQGVPEVAIASRGRGERDPVAECPGLSTTPELKQCLQPNRRVEINITE